MLEAALDAAGPRPRGHRPRRRRPLPPAARRARGRGRGARGGPRPARDATTWSGSRRRWPTPGSATRRSRPACPVAAPRRRRGARARPRNRRGLGPAHHRPPAGHLRGARRGAGPPTGSRSTSACCATSATTAARSSRSTTPRSVTCSAAAAATTASSASSASTCPRPASPSTWSASTSPRWRRSRGGDRGRRPMSSGRSIGGPSHPEGPLKLAVPRGALFGETLDLLDAAGVDTRRAARRLALADLPHRRDDPGDDAALRRADLRRGRRRRCRHHRQGRAARAVRPGRLRAARPRLRQVPHGAGRARAGTSAWANPSGAWG